jgi:DNA repair protein RadD
MTPEDALTALPRSSIVDLYVELELDYLLHAPAGLRSSTLAKDIIGYFGTDFLTSAPVRRNLLLHHERQARKLVSADPNVSRRMKDWPDLLYPKWRRGGSKVKAFCRAFGFDLVYAGQPAPPGEPTVEVLLPPSELHPLLPFQQNLADKILDAALATPPARIMASLPTGAGKTRTAIDAILRFQRERGGIVLWFALTNEVCEQACIAYRKVYESKDWGFPSAVHRLGGSHRLDCDFAEGFLVAGVQKLRSLLQRGTLEFRDSISLVIFDEAHHAIAPTYKEVLRFFAGTPKQPRCSLVGLTATPGRGVDPRGEGARRLQKEFNTTLVVPDQLQKSRNPVLRLQQKGVLSRYDATYLRSGRTYRLSRKHMEHLRSFAAFPPELLHQVGMDRERNALIVRNVTMGGKGWKTLIIACDVAQAQVLAYDLRDKGVEAQSITGETHPGTRRRVLERFLHGGLQVVTSVGVLTTGDAPRLQKIIVARPTTSPILFEQMVGRGLRGPRFGGTERCTIVDVVDVFKLFGSPTGFRRFEREWMRGVRA